MRTRWRRILAQPITGRQGTIDGLLIAAVAASAATGWVHYPGDPVYLAGADRQLAPGR